MSTSTDAPRIPVELVRSIVQFIQDQHSLLALSLTSSIFNAESEPILYCSMVNTNPDIQRRFLETVAHDRVRASYVHRYRSFDVRKRDIQDEGFVIIFEYLSAALHNMVNLRSLDFNFQALSATARDRLAFLVDTYPFKLDSFCGYGYFAPTGIREVLSFLTSQTELRRLALPNYGTASLYSDDEDPVPHHVVTTFMPNLIYLRGQHQLLTALLPGRNTDMVVWELNPFFLRIRQNPVPTYDDEIRSLAPYFKNLKYLSFGYESAPGEPLDDAFKSIVKLELPNLQCLELYQFNYDHDTVQLLKSILSLKMFIIPASTALVPWNAEAMHFPVYSAAQDVLAACPHIRFGAQFSHTSASIREYTVWDSRANIMDAPMVYRVPVTELLTRHIFEILPHDH